MEKEKIVLTGGFSGMSTKKDGLVDIKFKFPSDELDKCLHIFKFVSQNVNLDIKVDEDLIPIGCVLLTGFNMDKDANVTLKFTGLSEGLTISDLSIKSIGKIIKVRVQNV